LGKRPWIGHGKDFAEQFQREFFSKFDGGTALFAGDIHVSDVFSITGRQETSQPRPASNIFFLSVVYEAQKCTWRAMQLSF
jgi:hypothetical protein